MTGNGFADEEVRAKVLDGDGFFKEFCVFGKGADLVELVSSFGRDFGRGENILKGGRGMCEKHGGLSEHARVAGLGEGWVKRF